jgi:hypothetical protein
MRHRLSTCAFALVTLVWAAPADAQFNAPRPVVPGEDYRVELGLGFWQPEPGLVIRMDDLEVLGSDIDFVEEFGLEKERFREFRATIKMGRKHKVRVDYVPISYDAEATLTRTIVFNGQEFTIGVPVSAEVKWDFWKFGYEWDFVATGSSYAGLVVDLKYSKVSASLSSAAVGATFAEAKAPVPGIGGIGRAYFSKNFSVTGEFTAFKMPDSLSEEIDGKFFDFDVYATMNLGRNAAVQGGYRSLDVDYELEEDFGALEMKGFYFGGLVRF